MLFKRTIVIALSLVLLSGIFVPSTAHAQDDYMNSDPLKYYLLLDVRNQFITVYSKDDNGEYKKIVRRMLCSSGRKVPRDPLDPTDKGTPTPPGIWKSGGHERFGYFTAYGEYARYWTQLVDDIFFHSVLFKRRDVNAYSGGSYGSIGNLASHGCVRLYVEDAKWVYDNVPPGTTIKVSNNEPSQLKIRKALKSPLSTAEYKKFQANIYDEPETENDKAWITVEGGIKSASGGGGGAKLKIGDEVEILVKSEPWMKVRFGKREGYIRTAYLTTEKGVIQSKQDADIIKATVWMFSKPDNNDEDRIVKVPTDSSVKVLEADNNGWTKIQYWEMVGYVQSKSLKKGWGVIR
jgi:hypothetical protein